MSKKKLLDIYPIEWNEYMTDNSVYIEFRNLYHFKHYVSQIKQIEDYKCDISYAEALRELLADKSQIASDSYETIKNKVKNNLLKRGLISETIYESYKYSHEGDIIDFAKVAEQDPNCCLVPAKVYKNYFYELYLSISYPHFVTDEEVKENIAKILATIELLEKEHIYIKLTLVFIGRNSLTDGGNFISTLPLFSHKDHKSIETMSAIFNSRLLRKFYFAIMENELKENLSYGYGTAIEIPFAIRPMDIDECELASSILDKVLEKGTR